MDASSSLEDLAAMLEAEIGVSRSTTPAAVHHQIPPFANQRVHDTQETTPARPRRRRRGRPIVPSGDPRIDARRRQQRVSQRLTRQRRNGARQAATRAVESAEAASTTHQSSSSSTYGTPTVDLTAESMYNSYIIPEAYFGAYHQPHQTAMSHQLVDLTTNNECTAQVNPFGEIPWNLDGVPVFCSESIFVDWWLQGVDTAHWDDIEHLLQTE